MDVDIRPVTDRDRLETFIRLPARIHADHAAWVPPLYMHEKQYFDTRRNRCFAYCDTILLLAYRGGEAVGRAMGIVNHRYNELRGEANARFSCLETSCEDETAGALLVSRIGRGPRA